VRKIKSGKRNYSWQQRVAFVGAGAAVFIGGLGIGNLVNATESEPIILEPAQMPMVHNDFCEIAAATCAQFRLLETDDDQEPVTQFAPANYTA